MKEWTLWSWSLSWSAELFTDSHRDTQTRRGGSWHRRKQTDRQGRKEGRKGKAERLAWTHTTCNLRLRNSKGIFRFSFCRYTDQLACLFTPLYSDVIKANISCWYIGVLLLIPPYYVRQLTTFVLVITESLLHGRICRNRYPLIFQLCVWGIKITWDVRPTWRE